MAKKKIKPIMIRSSTAEHLTYIAPAVDQPESVEVRYEDENIWFSSRLSMMWTYVPLTSIYAIFSRTANQREWQLSGNSR